MRLPPIATSLYPYTKSHVVGVESPCENVATVGNKIEGSSVQGFFRGVLVCRLVYRTNEGQQWNLTVWLMFVDFYERQAFRGEKKKKRKIAQDHQCYLSLDGRSVYTGSSPGNGAWVPWRPDVPKQTFGPNQISFSKMIGSSDLGLNLNSLNESVASSMSNTLRDLYSYSNLNSASSLSWADDVSLVTSTLTTEHLSLPGE